MNRILLAVGVLISTMFLVSSQVNAQAVLWQEGKHYKVISEKATAKPEVQEFFSFWCGACFSFEPLVEKMKSALPKNVKFKKVHVNFMGFTGPKTQDDATHAMVIARTLKKEEQLVEAIFNYIHLQKATVANLDDLRSVFIVNGVEPEKFDKVAKSFSAKSLVKRNNNAIDAFREHLTGVPNFIVNGKYQATFTKDMTSDQIVDLIVWLSAKK